MELMQVSKKDFNTFVEKLLKEGKQEVVGVVAKGTHFVFDKLESAASLCLDYQETVLSPKKFFQPMYETLLKYQVKDPTSYEVVQDETPRIILGIHPGDMAALALLDKVFSEGQTDHHYLKRRAASTLVGIHHTQPYKYRFTSSMVKEEAYKAADVFLTDLGDSYGVEIVTAKGKALLQGMKFASADKKLAEKVASAKVKIKDEISMPMSREELPKFLHSKENHGEWKRRCELCFSCGSCVTTCPTCYCFDVKEELDLSLQKGERQRMWDGCMLERFATVAGNHNFRKLSHDRLKHRIMRKEKYLFEKFGIPGCVGCGRCSQACTSGIANPVEIVNALMKEEGASHA